MQTVVFALYVTVHEAIEEHTENEGSGAYTEDGKGCENVGCVHDDPPLING